MKVEIVNNWLIFFLIFYLFKFPLAEKSAEKDFLASFKSIRVKNTSFEQIKDTRKRLSLNNQILNFDFLRKNSHPGNNMNKNENDNNIYYIQKSEKENENFSDG